MTIYGPGSELAAQCPRVDAPNGWRPWFPDEDGPVPDALAKRAEAVAADQTVPLGATESFPLPGVVALIRAEPRVWGHGDQGALVQGCFRVGGIYLPADAAPGAGVTPPADPVSKAVLWLTAASLVVGTVATLATWGKS
jgi:hypothetical protein